MTDSTTPVEPIILMARRAAAAIAVAAALAAPSVAGAAADAGEIGDGLARDPVYIEPGAEPRPSRAAAERLRERIADRQANRIKIVVVDPSSARGATGVARLANAIDREHEFRGSILVAAGSSFHVLVSYDDVGGAIDAVTSSVEQNRGDGLAAQLLAAVDALAKVDPGIAGDPAAATPPVTITSPDEGLGDAISGAVWLIGAAIATAVLLPVLALLLAAAWRRWRRGEELDAEREEASAAARDELVALGDGLRALDLDVSMPGADAAGVAAYERALALYETADKALGPSGGVRRLGRATTALERGRAELESARTRLERGTAPTAPGGG